MLRSVGSGRDACHRSLHLIVHLHHIRLADAVALKLGGILLERTAGELQQLQPHDLALIFIGGHRIQQLTNVVKEGLILSLIAGLGDIGGDIPVERADVHIDPRHIQVCIALRGVVQHVLEPLHGALGPCDLIVSPVAVIVIIPVELSGLEADLRIVGGIRLQRRFVALDVLGQLIGLLHGEPGVVILVGLDQRQIGILFPGLIGNGDGLAIECHLLPVIRRLGRLIQDIPIGIRGLLGRHMAQCKARHGEYHCKGRRDNEFCQLALLLLLVVLVDLLVVVQRIHQLRR